MKSANSISRISCFTIENLTELQNVKSCFFKINHLNIRGEIQRKYKFHLDLYIHSMHSILLDEQGDTYVISLTHLHHQQLAPWTVWHSQFYFKTLKAITALRLDLLSQLGYNVDLLESDKNRLISVFHSQFMIKNGPVNLLCIANFLNFSVFRYMINIQYVNSLQS